MTNQSPIYAGHNAFASDGVLLAAATRFQPGVVESFLSHGHWVASAEALDLARLANENKPKLRTLDAKGERLDIVEFHPAYHALMRRGAAIGLTGSIWEDGEAEQGARHEARAIRFMLTSELENGHTCPLTMTSASIAPLMASPSLLADWKPRIISREYEASRKVPSAKRALTIGMGMTERQGGSDVRANTTSAQKGEGDLWHVNGEKWFFSAPMCDAFLILAQAPAGLSCFLIPRLLPDGSRNGIELQRLKDKLGNHSNASSEVKFVNTVGTLVGDEGAGIRTILDMVTLTRLDCALGSAGIMRAAFAEALHHTRHRRAFGELLIDQPLMKRVLADLALDVAAAQALSLRLARSFDNASTDEAEGAFARIMTPVVKYWVCKMAPALVYETMECLGGNGYVEESVLPRLYREAPLNAIWEGSGNIMCMDVLRVMGRSPDSVEAVLSGLAAGLGERGQQSIEVLRIAADMARDDPGSARILTEQLALTAAAVEMRRLMPADLGDAFLESRLGRTWRYTYGMLDARYDPGAIIDFVCPQRSES